MRGGSNIMVLTSAVLTFAIACNAIQLSPFSVAKAPLRPPSAPPAPGVSPGKLSWRPSGRLNCPWVEGIELPLCGDKLDLVADCKDPGGEAALQGRAVVCARENVSVKALWNAEIEEKGYPRFQNEREDGPEEFDRLSKVGHPFREWVAELMGERGPEEEVGCGGLFKLALGGTKKKTLKIGGLERIAGIPKPVVVCNGMQSNFIAPFDFIIADGAVVRQAYAKDTPEWAFPREGAFCWAMQLQGEGDPRIVSVCVGEGDKVLGQAREPLLPAGLLTEMLDDSARAHARRHPLHEGVELEPASIEEGVSGVPLILGGRNVCAGLQHRRPPRPIAPNELLWDPGQTRAAFSCLATMGGNVVMVSVTAQVTVRELANTLLDLGVDDALLLGGSGDVGLWVRGDDLEGEELHRGAVIHGPARPGGTRVGMFKPGERPLNCVVMASLR